MMQAGLVSITFRKLSPAAVLDAAVAGGVRALEWGGDVHCPHGDLGKAAEIVRLTHERGLTVAAYGSYYRLGRSEESGLHFTDVVASAKALGAPYIRVWAGWKGSAATTAEERAAVLADARRCALIAASAGVTIVTEWHANTLTDALDSGRDLLTAVDHPAFATVWQPAAGIAVDQAEAELRALLPWVRHLHVFHWIGHERRPLAEGVDAWRRYLGAAASTGRDFTAALEFVRNDDPAQLAADGATLNLLLKEHP